MMSVTDKRSINSRLHLRYPCRDALQTVAFDTRLAQLLMPIAGLENAGEHFPKHPIYTVTTLIGTFRVLTVPQDCTVTLLVVRWPSTCWAWHRTMPDGHR